MRRGVLKSNQLVDFCSIHLHETRQYYQILSSFPNFTKNVDYQNMHHHGNFDNFPLKIGLVG